ncbi:VOC family protein [Streptacidiphilus fuscans]|uniref:Glyoxalase n=1 Tax=Streptacidiphilus fuscans TaxID=2789292 RepID=A0A931B4T0_9ACTN|nr:VOC family protein [Streptacidiphilus fuscans]MBF9070211.1 glyoxalase [Streptacidiphilus fuscans]
MTEQTPPHGPLVHHVELWMDDLALAERQWGPVLGVLGCKPFQHWENGRSWRRDGSYVVIEQSPALRPGGHDRLRAGINHLALRCTPVRPEAVFTTARDAGWQLRVDTGQALHLTDSQGFELELVYDETPQVDSAACADEA